MMGNTKELTTETGAFCSRSGILNLYLHYAIQLSPALETSIDTSTLSFCKNDLFLFYLAERHLLLIYFCCVPQGTIFQEWEVGLKGHKVSPDIVLS